MPSEEITHRSPDFYMYGGDIESKELKVVRKCWRDGAVYSGDKKILIVRVEPGIPVGPLFRGTRTHVIGLASRSTLYGPGEFGPAPVSGAVVWRLEPTQNGAYAPVSSVGLVTIWTEESKIARN